MTRSHGDLFPSLQSLLQHTVNTFTNAGVDVPARQFVTAGDDEETPHDCEQLVVSFAQLYNGQVGQPLQEPSKCDEPWVVVVSVNLVRCTPAFRNGRGNRGQPPTIEELMEISEQQASDAELLMISGLTFAESDSWTGLTGMGDVQVGSAEGNYQQISLSLAYPLI